MGPPPPASSRPSLSPPQGFQIALDDLAQVLGLFLGAIHLVQDRINIHQESLHDFLTPRRENPFARRDERISSRLTFETVEE